MFNFLRRTPKVGGEIGYFGLQSWWLNNLSASERERIQERFRPLGSDANDLTQGEISFNSQSAVAFLGSLAGWFSRSNDLPIAYKILGKAEKLISPSTPVLDIHFLYQIMIEIYYRNRDSTNDLENAIEACKKQIAIAPEAAVAFQKAFPGSLPLHRGYEQLAIILEREKRFDEAIQLCEEASHQGWSSDWENRIARCNKRIGNA